MADTLTSDDPRYQQLFDIGRETLEMTGRIEGDLTPAMNALRDTHPVQHGSLRNLLNLPEVHQAFDCERDHYTLLSWELVERGFRENILFSSHVYRDSPGVRNFGNSILQMVGDEHKRYRAVVQPKFIRPRTEKWWRQNWIDEAVDALIERIDDGRTHSDLNMDLCARLPVHVVTRGIGMSGGQALEFREHLENGTVKARHLPIEQVRHAQAEMNRMLFELIDERRANPQEDVVSQLVTVPVKDEDGGEHFLDNEAVSGYCRLIMLAGGGTTWRQLGITLVALLKDYHLWEAVRDDRSLIEAAVDESARWMPTDPTFPRLMTQDTELAGVVVPAGARVDLCVGSANRDPARWDNPDVYDPFRKAQYHVGFGLGPHQCLGMNVAKQEMIVAINRLADQFPNMRLDPDKPMPTLHGGLEQRGMTAVPVVLK